MSHLFLYYILAISVIAILMTILDKIFAIRGAWRISENALLCASAFGGSVAMYLTMLIIRHKTRHIKFMAGIPLIIFVQLIFAAFVVSFLKRMA